MTSKPRIQMVVNRDSFFLSHRLPLARGARDAGMEVIVVAGDSGSARAIEAEGFEFVALPVARGKLNPFLEARTFAFLLRLYRRMRPALIHHSTVQPVIYGSIAARLVDGAAVVNTISGLGYPFTSNHRVAKALRPVLRHLWRIALSYPRSRTIFQNPDDRDEFIRRGLARAEATSLIRGSGVNCSIFFPTPEPVDEALVVVLPARMLWDKGIREFVEAARYLRAAGHGARFVLVGAPDFGNREVVPTEQLEAWSREGVVEWWGQRNDMPAILAGANIVVLPTAYGEGLPKALLEAGAASRPVVATDVPGCREVVRHGINGLLVPPRDARALARAIQQLLTSPELRSRLGRGGRRIAETEFAEPLVVDQTLAVYRQLL